LQRFRTFEFFGGADDMTPVHRIGLVLFPNISAISLAITCVFELVNWKLGYPAYELTLLSEHGGPIVTSLGNAIETVAFKRRTFDTILVGSEYVPGSATQGLLRYLQSANEKGTRIASICTGAFVLAQAGLLDGRKATTHWNLTQRLQQLYPKVKVDADRIFTCDGPIWTSAGMSAAFDLALALVEQDLGRDLALVAAKLMVVYHRRAGGQSQHSTLLDLDAVSDRVQSALTYAKKNLHKRLSVEDLAAAVFLSPRQFSRLFHEETGETPAKAVERLRVESARLMMEAGRFSIDEIARKNGFGNRDRMRRSFLRAFGVPPQQFQRGAGEDIPQPVRRSIR
jgi:transcriptional regulator GlxA family with amidase domain